MPEPVVSHGTETGILAEHEESRQPSMIQPSGLPGFRQATTKPTTAKAAETQTGAEPPSASKP